MSRFTTWQQYEHKVVAEILYDGCLLDVPFPYSLQTAQRLGRDLSENEVIDLFFRGYSEKMWGMSWDELPALIRRRVPKRTDETSSYFPGQFVARPTSGFTRMIENMLDGVDIRVGVGPTDWMNIPARSIVYTGRIDLIPLRAESFPAAVDVSPAGLPHRSLDIDFKDEAWQHDAACKNFCHRETPTTRKTAYRILTGGKSSVVSTETPRAALLGELAPFYPIPSSDNVARHEQIAASVRAAYPTLHLCGRLATYKYLDMFQAVGQAMALAARHFHYNCNR